MGAKPLPLRFNMLTNISQLLSQKSPNEAVDGPTVKFPGHVPYVIDELRSWVLRTLGTGASPLSLHFSMLT